MIPHRFFPSVLLSLLCAVAIPAMAQVPSYAPDDVPAASNQWTVTYQNNLVRTRPNHQVAFVQTGPNEQKVWFSVDVALYFDPSYTGPAVAYYNRRYRADANSPWYWQYTFSQPVSSITGFVDTVLYSPMARYHDASGQVWNYIMYTVNQPVACNGYQFGFATVQYSNDGFNWYGSTPLRHPGGPSAPCAPSLGSNLVQVEALDAVDDGQGTIWLIGMEGDASLLMNRANMDLTLAAWGTSSYSDTTSVTIDAASASISNSGIFSPALPNTGAWRFTTYSYFFNMAMAWDAANGDLYWTRGYPYPFDRYPEYGQTVPSASVTTEVTLYNSYWAVQQRVEGCATSPSIYPNRYQIYKMHLGTLSNFAQVHTGTWTLLADRGYSSGYVQDAALGSGPAALTTGQTAGDRDAGAASFLRDSSGNLVRTNGVGFVFGASTLMETLSAGPCRVTGNERIRLDSIP